MAARSAVVLLSGGLDSGVGLGMWLRDPDQRVSLCLTFDYGQLSFAAERRTARRLAAHHGLEWQAIELPWLRDAAAQTGCTLLSGELPEGTAEMPGDAASAASVWVPARNVVFLAIAAALAETRGASVIVTGFNREEAVTFPDNSAAFVTSMDAVLRLGTRAAVTVVAPTLELEKVDIVRTARELGLGAGDFWSCYRGDIDVCGRCESCLRSARAWREA